MLLRKCIATSLALFLAAAVHAAPVGTVARVDGVLLAKKADGRAKVLAEGSAVELGDTLLAEPETYASIRLAAGGELTLQPDSQLRIDRPAAFTLSKGGLRGNGTFKLDTPEGKVEVQGTADIQLVLRTPQAFATPILLAALDGATMSDAPLLLAQLTAPVPGAKAPGLYVQVLDGIIHLSNGGGAQSFTAGQFGYTASFIQPPIVLPANPGMQFTPPPTFTQSTAANSASSGGKSGSVDCEVR